MQLRFDASTHAYYLGDRRLPNVTGVLDGPISDYAGIPRAVLQAASERGTYVHKACELLVWDLLDWDSLEANFRPYVTAFANWLRDSCAVVHTSEERVWHRDLFYAGTLDLECDVQKRKSWRRAVVDIKTSFRLMPAVGPQLAAYQEARNSHSDKENKILDRYGLQLRADGTYRLQPYESPNDMNIFKSCLNILNFVNQEK
jgi:hypothetical protein